MSDHEPTSGESRATDGYAGHRDQSAASQKARSIDAREIKLITEEVKERTEEQQKLSASDVLLAVAGIALVLVYPVGFLVLVYFATRVVSCAWR